MVNLNILSAQHGAGLSLNGQDVTYVPSTDYNGTDTVTMTVCTNTVPVVCDTVYLFVTITSVHNIDTITVNLDRDSTYSGCIHFNDITSYTGNINFVQPQHGVIILTDSCFTYDPDSAFGGFDWKTAED